MIGIVLVSHSAALADGLAEMALIRSPAGTCASSPPAAGPDGTLGTRRRRHRRRDRARPTAAPASLVLADLGSAILSVKAALAERRRWTERDALLADAPLVEGAIAAAVAGVHRSRPGGGARCGARRRWSVRKL